MEREPVGVLKLASQSRLTVKEMVMTTASRRAKRNSNRAGENRWHRLLQAARQGTLRKKGSCWAWKDSRHRSSRVWSTLR